MLFARKSVCVGGGGEGGVTLPPWCYGPGITQLTVYYHTVQSNYVMPLNTLPNLGNEPVYGTFIEK